MKQDQQMPALLMDHTYFHDTGILPFSFLLLANISKDTKDANKLGYTF
jgi:hypothetical protein